MDRRAAVGPVRGEFEDRRHLERGLREGEVREPLDPIEPVVAERHPVLGHGHGQQPAALRPGIAAHLEDVGAVEAELELDRDA